MMIVPKCYSTSHKHPQYLFTPGSCFPTPSMTVGIDLVPQQLNIPVSFLLLTKVVTVEKI